MDLSLLIAQLKERFDLRECQSGANDPRNAGLRDAFFETTFQRVFVEGHRSGRDDLLFFVMWDPKAERDVVEVIRRDAKNLPSSLDPYVLWDKTLYLNLIMHEFEYQVTCSVITLKPGTDSVRNIKETVKLNVFPSPSERRMDKRGRESDVVFPNIMFCVDGFEEVFSTIRLLSPGEKVAVQLLATNKSSRITRMVFLGAVDYHPLKAECLKKDQASVPSRFRKLSFTKRSSTNRVHDLSHTYSFVKMHGPSMKGFAEMAISKANRTALPLLVASSAQMRVTEANGSSSPILLSRNKHFNFEKTEGQSSLSIEDEASSGSQQDFSTSANGILPHGNSDEAYATPSHHSSDLESETVRRSRAVSVITRQDSSVSEAELGGRSRSFAGRPKEKDTVSMASYGSTTSKGSIKEKFKRMARRKSASDMDFPISAFLTYIKLPWYTIVDDILNSTRRRVL